MAAFSIKNFFTSLFSQKSLNWAASFGAGYGRRVAEPHYDEIAETDFFKNLKNQSRPVKYFIEAVNNAVIALLDQKIDDSTPLRKLLKEIFMDSSSELNKRLLNGESSKKIIAEKSDCLDPKEKSYLSALLKLEEEKMDTLIRWILTLDGAERAEALGSLRGLDAEELEKIADLSPDARERLFQSLKKPVEEKAQSKFSQDLQSFHVQVDQWLTERLERKRRERYGKDS